MFTSVIDALFNLVATLVAMVALFRFASCWLDGHWNRRQTRRLIALPVLIAVACGVYGVCKTSYQNNRAWGLAALLGDTPIKSKPWYLEDSERYRPGNLWFGGGFAPAGFEHGTAWCSGVESEGFTIFTFAIEEPDSVVYVDVLDDEKLDAVYAARVKEGCFPSILKGSAPRRPTDEDRARFASLLAKMRKPAIARAVERVYGDDMLPK